MRYPFWDFSPPRFRPHNACQAAGRGRLEPPMELMRRGGSRPTLPRRPCQTNHPRDRRITADRASDRCDANPGDKEMRWIPPVSVPRRLEIIGLPATSQERITRRDRRFRRRALWTGAIPHPSGTGPGQSRGFRRGAEEIINTASGTSQKANRFGAHEQDDGSSPTGHPSRRPDGRGTNEGRADAGWSSRLGHRWRRDSPSFRAAAPSKESLGCARESIDGPSSMVVDIEDGVRIRRPAPPLRADTKRDGEFRPGWADYHWSRSGGPSKRITVRLPRISRRPLLHGRRHR